VCLYRVGQCVGDPLSKILRAAVLNRQHTDLVAGHDVATTPESNLGFTGERLVNRQCRVAARDDEAFIELIDDLADQWLQQLEVKHQTIARSRRAEIDRTAIIVTVEPFRRTVVKNQEVGSTELVILLLDVDRKGRSTGRRSSVSSFVWQRDGRHANDGSSRHRFWMRQTAGRRRRSRIGPRASDGSTR